MKRHVSILLIFNITQSLEQNLFDFLDDILNWIFKMNSEKLPDLLQFLVEYFLEAVGKQLVSILLKRILQFEQFVLFSLFNFV